MKIEPTHKVSHIPFCYVSVMDILGFKDLVYNNTSSSLSNILSIMMNVHNDNLESPVYVRKDKKAKVNVLSISDSIILYTNGDSVDEFWELCLFCKSFMYGAFWNGIPLRGAITHGSLCGINEIKRSEDNFLSSLNIVSGMPIVEGYSLTDSQVWSGCIITEKAYTNYRTQQERLWLDFELDYVFKLNKGQEILEGYFIIDNFPVPMQKNLDGVKNYYSESHKILTWHFKNCALLKNEEFVKSRFSMHNKTTNNAHVLRLINNTWGFLKDAPPLIDRTKEIPLHPNYKG